MNQSKEYLLAMVNEVRSSRRNYVINLDGILDTDTIYDFIDTFGGGGDNTMHCSSHFHELVLLPYNIFIYHIFDFIHFCIILDASDVVINGVNQAIMHQLIRKQTETERITTSMEYEVLIIFLSIFSCELYNLYTDSIDI